MIDFFKKKNIEPKIQKDKFLLEFLNDPNHHWICQDRSIKRSFEILLNSLKDEHIFFFKSHPTYFIPCQAKLSCAIGSTKNHHLILVFPELIQMLKSPSSYHAIAILAHELGHIYYQHTENKIETLRAQIEADLFATKLGFGEELHDVLLDHSESLDCQVRMAKITQQLIAQSK